MMGFVGGKVGNFFLTILHIRLSSTPPHTRRVTFRIFPAVLCSTYCPYLSGAGWCLQSDVVPLCPVWGFRTSICMADAQLKLGDLEKSCELHKELDLMHPDKGSKACGGRLKVTRPHANATHCRALISLHREGRSSGPCS